MSSFNIGKYTTKITDILFDLGNTLVTTPPLVEPLVKLAPLQIKDGLYLDHGPLLKIGQAVEDEIGRWYQINQDKQPAWQMLWQQAAATTGLNLSEQEVEHLCRVHLSQFTAANKVKTFTLPLLTYQQFPV